MKIEIIKILSITTGRFHCWCESNIGKIKKENNKVPDRIWAKFEGRPVLEEKRIKSLLYIFQRVVSKIRHAIGLALELIVFLITKGPKKVWKVLKMFLENRKHEQKNISS